MRISLGLMGTGLVAASLALSGCATTGSVKRAQARADEAYASAQEGNGAASRAQGTADNALAASGRAQSAADAANMAAQNAGNSANSANSLAAAAAADARAAREQVAVLKARLHKLEGKNKKRHYSKSAAKKKTVAKEAQVTQAQFHH
ncbi:MULTISPECIES: hypothetical protein [unclassified Novosphingobium]|uniref:hypothetical protein n=1 Tax=unclassified Novosphingobium TaxID=2644732 RepID=UPI00086D2CDD|nr:MULTISPECIES: hypothetical protein [unclassified Novosphingobium]MDR6708015.1 hypothetical protein [Novosphingobium sp. 1748]ODU82492.1 MAG: hypothetical protein ABT10_10060 [Novosphingobium sp. SCN 63-17]OJX92196.1 MAG: hypothetical protein BGP00_20190 [Novosphingobium sp. 63-713]